MSRPRTPPRPRRVVLVPGALALLPEYAGLTDPVADLRAACLAAVSWLGEEVEVVADPRGAPVAAHLLAVTERAGAEPSYLVVGNGSARRSERAPGHLDDRAPAFDAALEAALRAGDLTGADLAAGDALWAAVDGFARLGSLLDGSAAVVDYADDPFGVQYWVMRWRCES